MCKRKHHATPYASRSFLSFCVCSIRCNSDAEQRQSGGLSILVVQGDIAHWSSIGEVHDIDFCREPQTAAAMH
jgi:hypothetical protein